MSSLQIPPIPRSVNTSGSAQPVTESQPNPQNQNNQGQPVGSNPTAAETLAKLPPDDQAPSHAQISFEIPFGMFKKFLEMVDGANYVNGRPEVALLHAIDLWIQTQERAKLGELVAFLSENGNTTHFNLDNSINPEQFKAQLDAFYVKRNEALRRINEIEAQKQNNDK